MNCGAVDSLDWAGLVDWCHSKTKVAEAVLLEDDNS